MTTYFRVTATDDVYHGTSKTGAAFKVQLMFFHFDRYPYPLPVKQFVESVLPVGEYSVPYDVVVNRERLEIKMHFDKVEVL